MEKIGLALFLILAFTSMPVSAQMFESFEYGVPPAGWTKTNLLGGTGWYQLPVGTMPLPGWGNGTSSVPSTAGAGTHNAYCSWTTGGGASEGYHNDQWLISPQLNGLTATSSLSYWLRFNFTNFPDEVRVRISTAGPAPANFTLVIYTNIFSKGGGANQFPPWTNTVLNIGNLGIAPGTPIWVAIQEYEWDNTWNGAAVQLDVISSDLTVAAQPRASTTSLTFTAYYEGSDPAAQTFSIQSIGSSGMSFSNRLAFGAGSTNWLTLGGPSSGTLDFQNSQAFTASVSVAGLDLGTYYATNFITVPGATSSPVRIVMAFNVIRRPQTVSFPNPGSQWTTNRVGLAGTASSGLPVTFSLYSGPGVVTGATNLSFTGTGTVKVIGWQLGNAYYDVAPAITNAFTVTKPNAGFEYANMNLAYDGNTHTATVTTIPAGLTLSNTYNGSYSLPVNAGSYTVTSTVHDAMYDGTATNVFTITRMIQSINFPDPGPQWTTSRVVLAATADTGLPVTFSVASGNGSIGGGTNLSFTGDGSVHVVASQAGDSNHAPAAVTNTIAVTKVTAGVTLTNLNQTYDGTARVVGYESVPSGLSVLLTYDGNASAPTAAGFYTVTGEVNDAIYQGTNVGTLVVAKSDQTMVFPELHPHLTNAVVALTASASSGLPVTEFAVISGPGTIDGTNLSFSGAGDLLIEARQSGNGNWNAAPALTNLIKAFSVNPFSGPMAGGNIVLITNGRIGDGASITNVALCGVPATILAQDTNWVSVQCAPGTPGTSNILIQSDSDIVVSNAYTYNPTGTVFAVQPDRVSYVGGYPVTIVGTNLSDGSDVTNVTLCGIQATVQSQWPTQLVVLAGAAPGPLGPGDVHVYSVSHGETILTNAFQYRVSEITVLGTNGETVTSGEIPSDQKGTEFGSLSWGSTNIRSFAVTNSGQVNLGISGITTNGTGAAQFRILNMPSAVAAGSISNFQIAFAPDSVGVHTALVVIANDSTNSSYAVCLSGAGVRRDQTISFPGIADQLTTNRLGLAATAGSGLGVGFSIAAGGAVASISDGTNVTFTGTGVISIVASQAGNADWNAAPDVTNTFNVTKATAGLTLLNLNQTYNGTARVVTSQTSPTGLTVVLTYNGSPTAPVDVGSYAVTGTVDHAMYEGMATGTLVVTKAVASLTLTNLNQTYDGTARSVGYVSVPSGLSVLLSYDGHAWAPTNAGNYTVIGTVDETDYSGGATGALVVTKANQAISFPNIGNQRQTNVIGLAATAGSGFEVSFAVGGGPAQITDGTNLSFTGWGAVSVWATQAGDANWNAAPRVTNSFWVSDDTLFVLGTNRTVITNGAMAATENGTDFGCLPVNTTRTNRLAVTNNGETMRVIASWTTNGTGAAAFRLANVPTNVSQGVVSNFTMVFRSAQVGVYTAAVVVAHDGTNTPYVVNVIGSTYSLLPNSGSSGGGETVIISNSVPLGDGTDITNVLVCGVPATIVTQGVTWVKIQINGGGSGTGNVVIQSGTEGSTTFPNAYTYNAPDGGGGGGEEPPSSAESSADFRIKQTAVTPSKPSCGGKFVVWAQVENKGTVKGDAGYLSLTVDGKYFGAVKVGTLDKKKATVVKFTNVKTTKKYSPIVLAFKVDCYNVTRETNESNNTVSKNVVCK